MIRFIRKNGRIIPIKATKEAKKSSKIGNLKKSLRRHVYTFGTGATVGGTVGSYAATKMNDYFSQRERVVTSVQYKN